MRASDLNHATPSDQLTQKVELSRPESACSIETYEGREHRGHGVPASQVVQLEDGSGVIEHKACYAAQDCGVLGRPGCCHGGLRALLAQPQSGFRGWHLKSATRQDFDSCDVVCQQLNTRTAAHSFRYCRFSKAARSYANQSPPLPGHGGCVQGLLVSLCAQERSRHPTTRFFYEIAGRTRLGSQGL
jgi:hypothetical protein